MPKSSKVLRLVESATPAEALQFALRGQDGRSEAVIRVIAESPDEAFNALRFIPELRNQEFLVASACKKAEWARIILVDLPQWRQEWVFKAAIVGDPFWASEMIKKFDIKYEWAHTDSPT